jgi:hypothetical protein
MFQSAFFVKDVEVWSEKTSAPLKTNTEYSFKTSRKYLYILEDKHRVFFRNVEN